MLTAISYGSLNRGTMCSERYCYPVSLGMRGLSEKNMDGAREHRVYVFLRWRSEYQTSRTEFAAMWSSASELIIHKIVAALHLDALTAISALVERALRGCFLYSFLSPWFLTLGLPSIGGCYFARAQDCRSRGHAYQFPRGRLLGLAVR